MSQVTTQCAGSVNVSKGDGGGLHVVRDKLELHFHLNLRAPT